jgi:hypothetical protein
MKTIFSILIILVVFFSNANAQSINYEVIKDDPTFRAHGKFGFIYDADFTKNNNRTIYSIQTAVNLGERITVAGEFAKAFKKWDRVRENAVNEFSKSYMNINGRGTFFFKITDQKEDTRITLKKTSSSSSYYTITNETFIVAPSRTMTKIGVTGSAGYYRNNYLDNHKYDSTFQLNNQNGISTSSLNYGTSFSGMRFSGGIHFTVAKNFVINAKNASSGEIYGRKAVRNKTEVFAELLYMPTVGFESNLTAKAENGGGSYTIVQKPDMKNLGWRLLVESYTTGIAGIGLRMEFGARPGIKYDINSSGKLKNMYLAAGFVVALSK